MDGIAITDHNTLEGYFRVKKVSSDLVVVPGYEVKTDSGHILVYGLEKLPPGIESIDYVDLVDWVRGLGGLSIIAHPGIDRFHLREWRSCVPDAVEVLNASYPLEFLVGRGLKLAERLGVPGVGGSDAHSIEAVGDGYTVVECEDSRVENILDNIKRGCVEYEGGLSSAFSRFRIALGYLARVRL
jgi:predicted metal-dependent phosphoesterase TrpH